MEKVTVGEKEKREMVAGGTEEALYSKG